MITDIPDPQDYHASALELLNVAWGLVVELYYHLDLSRIEEWDDGEAEADFWKSSQRLLSTALVLTHQASDSFLQSRIASTSPYLLLSGGVRDWPSKCDSINVPFSAFRTHDSQDLPRVHDAVNPDPLSDDYRDLLRRLREDRNRAVHTVDPTLIVQPAQVLRFILDIAQEMIGPERWVEQRRDYLHEYPLSVVHSPDHVAWQLPFEITMAVQVLGASEVRKFFGIDKKQRRYICVSCTRQSEDPWRTVLLEPNEPASTSARCFVCETVYTVARDPCRDDSCPGNVIDSDTQGCLTCGADQ